MAHEIESAFYLKEPAWHGLGTVVQEAPTSEEALKLAGLDWDVTKEPLFLEDGTELEERVAIIRSTDRKVLGTASPDYSVVNNRTAFAFADALLANEEGLPVTFESAGSLKGGKRIWLLAHLPSKMILGDEVATYCVIHTSHDTNYATGAAMTPTRVVCWNTLTAALQEAPRQWKMRHQGDIMGRVKDAQMTLGMAMKYMDALEELAEDFQQRKVNAQKLNQIIELVFPILPDDGQVRQNNVMDLRNQFIDIYSTTDDLKAFRGDAWGVYNAFGDFASHIQPKKDNPNFKEGLFTSFIDGNKIMSMAQSAIQQVA